MRQFLRRFALFAMSVAAALLLPVALIPADHNQYLQAYNAKVDLLAHAPAPRVIFVGGSSTAFGLDSRAVADTLSLRVVNFGLHAGIGLRYPMADVMQHARRGDIVVLQIEYATFFEETCNAETMPKLMVATGWRNVGRLSAAEWRAVAQGMPMLALSHLKRLLLWPVRRTFDTPVAQGRFAYAASGFNALGDEVSHLRFPGTPYAPTAYSEQRPVRRAFVDWLCQTLRELERRGVVVVMLPPACVDSYFRSHYSATIAEAMQTAGYPYVVPPQAMTLPDSLAFDSGYHLNREGVSRNTQRIITILSSL